MVQLLLIKIFIKQRVKTWIRKDFASPGYNKKLMATDLEQAYEIQDWMFIFEAATATHLQVIGEIDDCTLLRRQELHTGNQLTL